MTHRNPKTGRFARTDAPIFAEVAAGDDARIEQLLARVPLPADAAGLVAHLSGEGEG